MCRPRRHLGLLGITEDGNVENPAIVGSGKFQFPAPKWPPDPTTPNFLEGPPVAAIEERASRKFFERLVGAASPESGARRRRWFRDRHSYNWVLTLDRLLLRPA